MQLQPRVNVLLQLDHHSRSIEVSCSLNHGPGGSAALCIETEVEEFHIDPR